MGLADREYFRNPSPPPMFNSMRMWSVNTWLIIINVAVFLLDSALFQGMLYDWGYFSAAAAVFHLQVWRFITFQFLHAGSQHLLFNMLSLFFFGPMIESFLGSRRYLAFYLLCGIAGSASYLILLVINVLHDGAFTHLVGASAGIFGVLMGAAQVAPNATVLVFGVIPMRLRTMAWLLLGYAVFTVFTAGPNAGGEAAHIGGAILGLALIRNPRILSVFDFRSGPRMRYRP